MPAHWYSFKQPVFDHQGEKLKVYNEPETVITKDKQDVSKPEEVVEVASSLASMYQSAPQEKKVETIDKGENYTESYYNLYNELVG